MLPIVLVLLVATSALAAPTVNLDVRSINEVAPQQNTGYLNNGLTSNVFENTLDGGDLPVYITQAQQVLNDLSNQRDAASRAYSLAQIIALISSVATGVPGDACASAQFIDSYVNAVRSGINPAGAVQRYVQNLVSGIDQIVLLANNPSAARFSYGPRGSCSNAGRVYSFEAAWDSVLANIPANSAGLLNEQYCIAKRLYNAFSARSNNAGAALTAASLPPVNAIFQRGSVQDAIVRFLGSVTSGNASAGTAAVAKQALLRASQY